MLNILLGKKSENVIYFLCKITNEDVFKEEFPDNKVQPHWEYYPNKKVIKIKIEDYDYKPDMSFEEFMLTTSINHEFFESFGELFIYAKFNDKINVFKQNEKIKFSYKNIQLKSNGKKYNLSDYYLQFENQNVTPEMLLLNYDLDLLLEDVIFEVDKMKIMLNENF